MGNDQVIVPVAHPINYIQRLDKTEKPVAHGTLWCHNSRTVIQENRKDHEQTQDLSQAEGTIEGTGS